MKYTRFIMTLSVGVFWAASILGLGSATAQAQGGEENCSVAAEINENRQLNLSSLFANDVSERAEDRIFPLLKKHEAVLTFDDGPSPFTTPEVLDILEAHCVKATFFLLGLQAVRFPEIVQTLIDDGHTVGSHGYGHINHARSSGKRSLADIDKAFEVLTKTTDGKYAPFFRFPYLRSNSLALDHLKTHHVQVVGAHIDSGDYLFTSPKRLVRRIMRKLRKKEKGIILLHDTKQVTAEALPLLLKSLKDEGYSIVHLRPQRNAAVLADSMAKTEGLDNWVIQRIRGGSNVLQRPHTQAN